MTPRPAHITGMTLCSGIGAPEVAAPVITWIMDRMRYFLEGGFRDGN